MCIIVVVDGYDSNLNGVDPICVLNAIVVAYIVEIVDLTEDISVVGYNVVFPSVDDILLDLTEDISVVG